MPVKNTRYSICCPILYFIGSDASSEHSVGSSSTGNDSISAKNPYLALDTSGNVLKKAIDRVRDDLRIDDSLFNPEALYDRTQPPVLSLGRMNNLGQFVSEFDPTPDHERNKGKPGLRIHRV